MCLLSPPAPIVQVFQFQGLSSGCSSLKFAVQLLSQRFAMSTCSTEPSLGLSPSAAVDLRNQRERAVLKLSLQSKLFRLKSNDKMTQSLTFVI